MSRKHGKRAAIALCLVAVPVAALALRKPVMEAWHLHRLRDEGLEQNESMGAIKALVELKCYRALPEMAGYIGEETGSPHEGPRWAILEPLQGASAWPYLREAQESERSSVRNWAWLRLIDTGREDAAILEAFRRAIQDEDSLVSGNAVSTGTFALGSRAAKILAEQLASVDPESESRVIACLLRLGPLALEAEGPLRQTLQVQPNELWSEIVSWLEELGLDPRPDLEQALKASNPKVRFLAATELGKREPLHDGAAEALIAIARQEGAWLDELNAFASRNPAALELLFHSDSDADIFFGAIETLDAWSIPILLRALAAESREIHERAWQTLSVQFAQAELWLATLADASPEHVEELIRALDTAPDEATPGVLDELSTLGTAASTAAPVLEKLLVSRSLEIRIKATQALASVEPERPISASFLVPLVNSSAPEAPWALWALMALGPRAAEAVPALFGLAESPHWEVMCIWTLRSIGWPAYIRHAGAPGSLSWKRVVTLLEKETLDARAIPVLRELLLSEENGPHWVWQKIEQIGVDAAPLVPALAKIALNEIGDFGTRLVAIYTLGFLGPTAVAPLTELLDRDERSFTEPVLRALARLGPAARDAIPSLLRALRRRGAPNRVLAAKALERIGAAAVPSLIEGLADPSEDIRCLAAHALGRIGPAAGSAAASATPALRARLEDPSPLVRKTAERALAGGVRR